MIRDCTDTELHQMRTEAYRRYASIKYRKYLSVFAWFWYRKYVALDDLIKDRQRSHQNLTLREVLRYNKKEKTS